MMGTLRTFAPLAWRNLWRNAKRTLITLIVVSIGLWSVLFFNAFLNAWGQASKAAVLDLLIGQGQIHAQGYLNDPSIDALMSPPNPALEAALNGPDISVWAVRLQLPGVVVSEYKTLPVNILGVDPASEIKISSIPGKIVEGKYLTSSDDTGVILGLNLAEKLKTGLGRRVILMSQNTEGQLSEQSFTIVGLFDADKATEDFYIFTGLRAAHDFVGLKDQIAQIAFAIPDPEMLDQTVATLAAAAPDLDVRSWKKLSLFLATTDSFMQNFIYIWLAVVFSLMAIGIVNTQLMAVFERTHEFGLLQALGMKPRQVLYLVALESVFMIGIGVLLGAIFAALTIWSLSDGLDLSAFAEGLEMFQGGQVLYPEYDVAGFVLFSLTIWGLGILVALWPARRAAKLSPVQAMRHAT
ncbi:MAG: ABC-type lipoprotein release transport system permease subunit [Paracoccaceae bacterium]|jgi:ABC-type lipoprotein release transport system permease subunit